MSNMDRKTLIQFFQEMEDMDDTEVIDDLETAVRSSDSGIEVILENLEKERCAHKSMAIAMRLKLKEAAPLIQPYLESEKELLRRQAEITLVKLGANTVQAQVQFLNTPGLHPPINSVDVVSISDLSNK